MVVKTAVNPIGIDTLKQKLAEDSTDKINLTVAGQKNISAIIANLY